MSKKYSSKRTVVTTKDSLPKPPVMVNDLDTGTIFRHGDYMYMLIKLEYPNSIGYQKCLFLNLDTFLIEERFLDCSVDEVYDYQINLQAQGIY